MVWMFLSLWLNDVLGQLRGMNAAAKSRPA